jgi:hypothetical protein
MASPQSMDICYILSIGGEEVNATWINLKKRAGFSQISERKRLYRAPVLIAGHNNILMYSAGITSMQR